jgi:hypothetical protein
MQYQLYGLVIASHNLFFGEISIGNREVDVQVRSIFPSDPPPSPSNWFMNWTLPGGEEWLSCAKTEGGYLLRFNELADFTIDRNGREIVCMPRSGIPEYTIQHLLLDQVIPLVINLRGGEALHASAILTSHGVVAFAGAAGSGKSTLAGSFLLSGHQHMSDDCLALLEKDQEIYAIPAYPGLRLWDDALSHLFGKNGAHESVSHYTDKRRVQLQKKLEANCTESQPLRRLYAIADPSETERKTEIMIERLSPRESFMALVRCAFRLDITDNKMLRRQFYFLERVVSTVSIRRLIFPRDFRLLPAIQEAILKDLESGDN